MVTNEVTERTVTLSEAERSEIMKTIRNYWLGILITIVATGFFLLMMGSTRTIGGIIISAVIIVIALIAIFLTYVFKTLTSKDLKANQKKILTGPVEEKRIGASQYRDREGRKSPAVTMTFRLTLNGKEYFAPDYIYLGLRKGDLVELHILPESGKTLNWLILKDKTGVNLTGSADTSR